MRIVRREMRPSVASDAGAPPTLRSDSAGVDGGGFVLFRESRLERDMTVGPPEWTCSDQFRELRPFPARAARRRKLGKIPSSAFPRTCPAPRIQFSSSWDREWGDGRGC